jgi:ribosomal protein S12 methylthiotransferase accessory factor
LKTIESKLRRAGFIFEPIAQQNFIDDFTIFRDVELPDGVSKWLRGLTRKFYESDLPLLIKDITSDISIPTFVASSIEWISSNYGYLAEGHGTHPDARIAMTRAITELSQTRAANIHGARDDLRKISFGENNTDDKRAWQFLPSKNRIRFEEIGGVNNEDILDDINLILEKLKSVGISMAAVVDLSNSDIGIPVVRAIVPGLETFKITKSVIGWRAKKYFKRIER